MSTDSVTGKHPAIRDELDFLEENEPKRARTAGPDRVQLDLDTDSNSGSDSGSDSGSGSGSDRTSDFSESESGSEVDEHEPPKWLVTIAHQLVYVNGMVSDDPQVEIADLKRHMVRGITSNAGVHLKYESSKKEFAWMIDTVMTMISALSGVVSRETVLQTVATTLVESLQNLEGSRIKKDKTVRLQLLPPVPPATSSRSFQVVPKADKPRAPKADKPRVPKADKPRAPKEDKPAPFREYPHLPTTWNELCAQAAFRYDNKLCAIPAAVLAIFGNGHAGMRIGAKVLRDRIGAVRCNKVRSEGVQEGGSDPKKSILSATFTDWGKKRLMQEVSLRKDVLEALERDPSMRERFLEACKGSRDYRSLSANFDGEYDWPLP